MGSINKRDLKAYVRYDGSGRVVAGSLVLRRSIPKVGKWQEVQGYQCCNQDQQTIVVTVEGSFPITSVDFTILCNTGPGSYMTVYTAHNAADIYALASLLNQYASQYGYFKVDAYGELLLEVNYDVSAIFAAGGCTELQAAAFAD